MNIPSEDISGIGYTLTRGALIYRASRLQMSIYNIKISRAFACHLVSVYNVLILTEVRSPEVTSQPFDYYQNIHEVH